MHYTGEKRKVQHRRAARFNALGFTSGIYIGRRFFKIKQKCCNKKLQLVVWFSFVGQGETKTGQSNKSYSFGKNFFKIKHICLYKNRQ